jgi:hypothetical protein
MTGGFFCMEPVYQEWASREVSSSHGGETSYYVFLGTVNWTGQSGDEQVAYVVLMRYGNQINYQLPAHILEQDLDRVLGAIRELREERQNNTER